MRVVLAHSRYRSSGGEEFHIKLTHSGLQRAGIETMLYERNGSSVHGMLRRVSVGIGLVYNPRAASDLTRVMRSFRPDVVHFHNLLPLLTPSTLRAAKRSGCRVVLTAHNYRFACPAGTLLRNGRIHEDCIEGSSLACGLRNSRGVWSESVAYGIAISLHRRLGMLKRWVDAFVAPSAFVGRMLVRSGLPAERVHVIHNGVPLEVASGDPKEPRVAVFAGRLSTEKGLHVLLDAARYVPSVRLVIAGDGPLCGVVHERRLPNVKYLGRLEQRELSALRKHAVFTVLPSLSYDVSPSSAIESLAAGVPVIASDIGGIPEIIHHEETGLLVERDNAKQLAEAMLQLWDDDGQRRLLGEQGRRFIGNEYGADRQVERLVELYGGLLAA